MASPQRHNLIRVEKPLPNRPNRVLWVYNAFQDGAHEWRIFYTADFTRAKVYKTLNASQIIIDGGEIDGDAEDIVIIQVEPRDGITPVTGGGGGIIKVATLSAAYPVGKFQIGSTVVSYVVGPSPVVRGTGSIVAPLYPERHRVRFAVLSGTFSVGDGFADETSNTLGGTIIGIV